MTFEWDNEKAEANLTKHGIDFEDVTTLWDRPVVDPFGTRQVAAEERLWALGTIGPPGGPLRIVFVVYTWRNNRRRLISVRKANTREQAHYNQNAR